MGRDTSMCAPTYSCTHLLVHSSAAGTRPDQGWNPNPGVSGRCCNQRSYPARADSGTCNRARPCSLLLSFVLKHQVKKRYLQGKSSLKSSRHNSGAYTREPVPPLVVLQSEDGPSQPLLQGAAGGRPSALLQTHRGFQREPEHETAKSSLSLSEAQPRRRQADGFLRLTEEMCVWRTPCLPERRLQGAPAKTHVCRAEPPEAETGGHTQLITWMNSWRVSVA